MEFAIEAVTSVWKEALPLLMDNQVEVGLKDLESFDPDIDRYIEMEGQGAAKVFTYRKDGVLVGYCLVLFFPHPHYRKSLTAFQDVLYVTPKHRGFGAVKFIKWIDEQIRALGAETMNRSVSVRVDYARTLERLGYVEVESSFVKNLT